jgi:hypothetical protein
VCVNIVSHLYPAPGKWDSEFEIISSDSALRFVDARHNGKLKVRFELNTIFGMSNDTGELINTVRLQSSPFNEAPFIVGLESLSTTHVHFCQRHLRITAAIEFSSLKMRDFESHKKLEIQDMILDFAITNC